MDMIMMYRILNGLEGLPFDDLFSFYQTITRTNGYKLYKQFSHLNCRKYFFSQRIIEDWNKLLQEIIESTNMCDRPRENRPSSHLGMIVEISVLKIVISFCSC